MSKQILSAIVKDFSAIEEIKSIVLSGSSSTQYSDEISDYDIYIYSDKNVDIDKRKTIAKKYANTFEINNLFFETNDEWILKESTKQIDIAFRFCKWIETQIDNVLNKHLASNGYSTCFIYNVQNSEILYDTDNWFLKLQNITHQSYPNELSDNIIKRNLLLLKDKATASYFEQIEKAIKRNDFVSVNHRISAFLASYFDIILAKNKIFHPGEKRLIKFCLNNCKILPDNFETNIENLLKSDNNNKLKILDIIIKNLRQIL